MQGQEKAYPAFEEVWKRIVANAGQTFHTKDNTNFTYSIHGDEFHASPPSQKIQKSDFARAYEQIPIHKDALNVKIVKGPAFVWEVLHDPRISKGEW